MDIFEAIDKRCSYRGDFVDQAIPRADLKKIVQCGIHAPSGCNAQTTSFVIVDDPKLLAAIHEIIGRPVCRTAKALIACIVDPRPVYHDMSFGAEDCAAAVENMLLAIAAMGYATVWLDGVLRVEEKAAKIAALLGVPEGLHVRIVLPLGIPTQPCAPQAKKPFAERAWFNKFGEPGPGSPG